MLFHEGKPQPATATAEELATFELEGATELDKVADELGATELDAAAELDTPVEELRATLDVAAPLEEPAPAW